MVENIAAIANIVTPIVILILSVVGWKYRQSIERKFKIEEKLRDERIEIYNQILEPFIIMLMTDAAWSSDPKNKNKDKYKIATTKLLSLEYRKISFKLSLIGSDPVVSSYNNLMQHFYSKGGDSSPAYSTEEEVIEIMSLLGNFLLEVRRSMGNDSTRIDNWGMLEWFITDARKYRVSSSTTNVKNQK